MVQPCSTLSGPGDAKIAWPVIRRESCCCQHRPLFLVLLAGGGAATTERVGPRAVWDARPSILIKHMPHPTKAVDGNHDIFPVPDADQDAQGIRAAHIQEVLQPAAMGASNTNLISQPALPLTAG
jgi:hypothetical protein